MEQIYKLPLVLEPQPESGYTITCLLVPDLVTEADTLDEVQPHVADALAALIEIYEDRLVVKESSRMFVRNVCMAFDLRLVADQPEKRIFSMTI